MYKFFTLIKRLRLIQRWALVYTTTSENVVEHSWEVGVLAHLLACIHNEISTGFPVDVAKVALLGLYHDSSEAITGDLPTPIKYKNPDLTIAYKKIEKTASMSLVEALPSNLSPYFLELLDEDKQDLTELYLVKCADKLSALLKCKDEILRGNLDFQGTYQNTLKVIKDLKSPEIEYFITTFLPPGTIHES